MNRSSKRDLKGTAANAEAANLTDPKRWLIIKVAQPNESMLGCEVAAMGVFTESHFGLLGEMSTGGG